MQPAWPCHAWPQPVDNIDVMQRVLFGCRSTFLSLHHDLLSLRNLTILGWRVALRGGLREGNPRQDRPIQQEGYFRLQAKLAGVKQVRQGWHQLLVLVLDQSRSQELCILQYWTEC